MPIWRLGFRPFFLLASLTALLAIPLWVLIFFGIIPPVGAFNPMLWHAHEMIYGYATAVIAGFVLTASQNWTGRPGLKGRPLAGLTGLWVLGRVLMMVTPRLGAVAAVVDLAFYPALGIAMIPYLAPSDMKVERVFFAYFALFLSGNTLMHLDALNLVPGYGLRGALLGLHTTILMIVFMGGRVIPFFTESELARAQPRSRLWVERLSHLSAWAFVVTQLLAPSSAPAAAIAFFACAVHLLRLRGWYVRRVRRIALLAILHLSYLWIVIGFGLTGLETLGWLALGPPVHAFAVGGLGMMTFGMMSRVSLGHTGRKLRPSHATIRAFGLLALATVIRVLGPALLSQWLRIWIGLAALLWCAAFALFVRVYWPMLVSARIDAREG